VKKAAAVLFVWWPFAALFLIFFWPLLLLQKSFVLYDYSAQHLPWAMHTYAFAKQGSLPFWTNAMALGFPLFAEGQSASLYFVHWLGYRVLPFFAIYTWSIPFHFLAGGIGAYLYARRLGVSVQAAALAAVCFCFSSAYAGCFYNTGSLRTLCWLPLELWLLEMIRSTSTRSGLKALAGLVFLVCQQWLAGFPQMAVYAFLYLTLHELLAPRLRSFTFLIAAFALGTLAAWPQITATLELISQSVRSNESASFALWGSVPPLAPVSLLFPEWGNTLRFSFYLGMMPLLLCAAPFFLKREGVVVHQAWLAVIFFLLALGRFNPVYAWAVETFHLTSMRNPAKFLFFVLTPLSVLTAFGYDALLSARRGSAELGGFVRFSVALAGAMCSLPLAGQIALRASASAWPHFSEWYVTRLVAEKGASAKDPVQYLGQMDAFFRSLGGLFSYGNAQNLQAMALALLAAGGIALFAWKKISAVTFTVFVGVLLVWDLGVFGFSLGAGFIGNAGELKALEPTPKMQRVLKVVQQNPGVFAELVKDASEELFPPNSGITYGVRHAGGYSPLLLSHYYELVRDLGIVDSSLGRAPFSEEVWRTQRSVVDLTGIRYLHTDFPLEWQGLALLDSGEGSYLYENAEALPEVTGYSVWRVIPDKEERLRFIKSRDFVPSREIILEDEKSAAGFVPDPSGGPAVFRELPGSRPEELRFQIEMFSDGVACVRVAAYPGWELEVDGRKAEWGRVNHAFIGFPLKKGAHEVHLNYRRKLL